jgi:large subunit ribosomal protein L4
MKLQVSSTIGQNSTLTVNDAVFGVKPNQALIAQAVRVYLSNQRQGTSKVLTRSEVSRTKKKWFKQKGTGNARHGARTPNIFVGGGVAHGPTGEQNWNLKMATTMRRSALISALSAQVPAIIVSEDLNQLDGKTSSAQRLLRKMMPNANRLLVVLADNSPLVLRSIRNLTKTVVTHANRLTTYEVAAADGIVMTKEAVKVLEDRLTKTAEKVKRAKSGPAKKTEVKAEAKTEVVKAAKPAAPKKAAPKAAKPAVKKAPAKKATTPSRRDDAGKVKVK